MGYDDWKTTEPLEYPGHWWVPKPSPVAAAMRRLSLHPCPGCGKPTSGGAGTELCEGCEASENDAREDDRWS